MIVDWITNDVGTFPDTNDATLDSINIETAINATVNSEDMSSVMSIIVLNGNTNLACRISPMLSVIGTSVQALTSHFTHPHPSLICKQRKL